MIDKIPIALLVDDPCPLIHVYRYHWEHVHHKPPFTVDGRPLLDSIPNSFLDRFCDVMERWSIRGKFSVVPAPAGFGDIVQGIAGFDPSLTTEWLATVRRRLGPLCDFCPEGITHDLAVDLINGGSFDEGESQWSQHQDRSTLTPYLVRQLEYLKAANIDATGVTSPWVFGIDVEQEYVASIVAAQRQVFNRAFSWYFLHMEWRQPSTRPSIAFQDMHSTLVSIPATVADHWWETINSSRADSEFVSEIADRMLTSDGRSGQILNLLDSGGWPVILTHWQSLFSNGLETGLAVLDELARRIDRHLSERVAWTTCSDIARKTVAAL